MKKIRQIIVKYKVIIMYLIFGGLTTAVNVIIYVLGCEILNLENLVSTVIAWIVAVIFAFITNKRYVFESTKRKKIEILQEASGFFVARLLTGILDVAIMYIAVDCMEFNSLVMKIMSNVVVTMLNYIISRTVVFK